MSALLNEHGATTAAYWAIVDESHECRELAALGAQIEAEREREAMVDEKYAGVPLYLPAPAPYGEA